MTGPFEEEKRKWKDHLLAVWRRVRRRVGTLLVLVTVIAVVFGAVSSTFPRKAQGQGEIASFWALCGFAIPCWVIDASAVMLESQLAGIESKSTLEQAVKFGAMITNWMSVDTLLGTANDKQNQAQKDDTGIIVGAVQAVTANNKEVEKAESDNRTENLHEDIAATTARKTPIPNETDLFLCNKILACQAVLLAREYARQVARVIAEGAMTEYRGVGEDGGGGSYIVKEALMHCPFASALDGGTCIAPTTDRKDVNFQDLDLIPRALEEGEALDMPLIVEEEQKQSDGTIVKKNVFKPEKGKVGEIMWFGAVSYCYQIAGPRPTPPVGAELDTPEGRVKKAQWNHCASLQSIFTRTCMERVARLTRPNCSTEGMSAYCEEAKKACKAGKEALNPDADEKSVEMECTNGMSLEQSERLCNDLCGASRRFQSAKANNASDSQLVADIALCNIVEASWRRKQELERAAFVAAAISMQSIQECWKQARYR